MIVLDTHALLWAAQDDPKLGRAARARIEEESRGGRLLVPAICAWEIALLAKRGQIRLELDPAVWIRRVLLQRGYGLAPLEPDIAVASVLMDWPHKDPADRMIVATARHWRAPLMTVDREILAYAEAGHVEIINAVA